MKNDDEVVDLVSRAQQGESDALLELIMHKKDQYFKLAMVYLRCESDALDAVQDMTETVFKKIKALKKPSAFYSWSNTILVNRCKSLLKKKKKFVALDSTNLVENDQTINTLELRTDLNAAMSQLSVKHREVISLRYDLDMSYEEIAHFIGVPIGTVKSRLNKGLSKLRQALERGDGHGSYQET